MTSQPPPPERPVRTDPRWSLFTTFTVNLLDVPTHRHGPCGKSFVSYKDATEVLFACIKALEPHPDVTADSAPSESAS